MHGHLGVAGAQTTLVQDLQARETLRQKIYTQELAERETEDILDRALLKAKHSKEAGRLSAPDYRRLESKIDSLKKLRFTEDYEKLQDRETYEFMKYKVAAEVGDTEEIEAFKLYEKTMVESRGLPQCISSYRGFHRMDAAQGFWRTF